MIAHIKAADTCRHFNVKGASWYRRRPSQSSFGKLDFVPVSGRSISGAEVFDGVLISLEIPDKTVRDTDRMNIYHAASWEAGKTLGDLKSQYDHVMYCVPPRTNGNWVAAICLHKKIH